MHPPRRFRFFGIAIALSTATVGAQSSAQTPPPSTPPPRPTQASRGARAERAPDYPVRPPVAPEVLAHGQQLFRSNCSFCHGSDARGGETGPNLVRDQVVLADQQGELIAPVVQNGIPSRMPKLTLSATEIADIAAWLHS